jgi:hypothetical protein
MKTLILAIGIFTSFLFFGCEKQKDTTAKVIVRDISGELSVGTTVNVYPESTTFKDVNKDLIRSGITDGTGSCEFNYTAIYKSGQAGVAVFNVFASKIVGSDTLRAYSYIKLDPEKANETTVRLADIPARD